MAAKMNALGSFSIYKIAAYGSRKLILQQFKLFGHKFRAFVNNLQGFCNLIKDRQGISGQHIEKSAPSINTSGRGNADSKPSKNCVKKTCWRKAFKINIVGRAKF